RRPGVEVTARTSAVPPLRRVRAPRAQAVLRFRTIGAAVFRGGPAGPVQSRFRTSRDRGPLPAGTLREAGYRAVTGLSESPPPLGGAQGTSYRRTLRDARWECDTRGTH